MSDDFAEYERELDARAADRAAAHEADRQMVHEELRQRAELSRQQIQALAKVQSEMLAYAAKTEGRAAKVAAGGDRGVAQRLMNWAADLRSPFQGDGRSGFAGQAPLGESTTALRIFDDARAFAELFTPAVLADAEARGRTITRLREALGRVDGHLSAARTRRGQIETLLQQLADAAPAPAGAVSVMTVTRAPHSAAPVVVSKFDPGELPPVGPTPPNV